MPTRSEADADPSSPPDSSEPPRGRRRLGRLRALLIAGGAAVALVALLVGVSVIGALRTPGNENFKAKWADWLRSHDAAFLVDRLETVYFQQHAPHKGGRPSGLDRVPPPSVLPHTTPESPKPADLPRAPRLTTTTAPPLPPHLAPPLPVPLVVHPSLPGEGLWSPTGPLVDGLPGMYVSQFRADDIYTSQITKAVWIDPKLLRVGLVAGAREPGGRWFHPPYITDAELPNIVAAFNGGFRFQDAHGGFFLDGRQGVPLVTGAASVVIDQDGTVQVGAWGRDISPSPAHAGVLQNLTLLVDGGRIDPAISHNDTHTWGATLGGRVTVARSGIGITADGALVYVAGPALTAKTLAESLQRAGAVRAMTLDINPTWVTFNLYEHPDPNQPRYVRGTPLFPQQQRPGSRYLPPTAESRDFFTISLR